MGREAALLAAFTFALVAFISVGILVDLMSWDKRGLAVAATAQTVHLDYMHAGWCEYCDCSAVDIEAVARGFEGRVELEVWDESKRGSDGKTAEIYERYKQDGLFGGFPTIVADGKKMLVGKRDRAEIEAWVCAQFENKPEQCVE